jgi:DDE superfamily endonuclease
MWCIPPKHSAEFVYHMEDVLAVYCRPHDPQCPVVCMDETSAQLIGETRTPLPPRPGAVERYDHEYVRNGVASLFLATEPLAGWRHVAVTDHRCRTDWAVFIRSLAEGRYRDAERIVLIMDQLNTHSPASLYEAFPPAEAKRLAPSRPARDPSHAQTRILAEYGRNRTQRARTAVPVPAHRTARHLAPKDRGMGTPAKCCRQRRQAANGVKWHFTTEDARIKLRSLYPSVDT